MADSPRAARDQLRQRGFTVITFRELSNSLSRSPRWTLRPVPSPYQLVSWIRDVGMLLRVGIPLAEALQQVLEQQQGRWRVILQQVQDQVVAGVALADALRTHPRSFDELTVQLTQVGEASGHLDESLQYLAEFKDRSLTQRDQAVSALLYPCVVLIAAIGVTLFLMLAIVPPLLDNLIEAGRALPWPTRWLKWVSDGCLQYGIWWGTAGLIGLMAITLLLQTKAGRRLRDRWLLQLPLFGELFRKQELCRCSRLIAVMSRSGIDLVRAISLAEQSLTNLVLREGLERSRLAVSSGVDLGPALQRAQVFPPLVVQIFAVGQQSGQLEEMLERLAADYDRQVSSLTQRLLTLLEPALIVLLSVIVGFILFATILPILEAGNVL